MQCRHRHPLARVLGLRWLSLLGSSASPKGRRKDVDVEGHHQGVRCGLRDNTKPVAVADVVVAAYQGVSCLAVSRVSHGVAVRPQGSDAHRCPSSRCFCPARHLLCPPTLAWRTSARRRVSPIIGSANLETSIMDFTSVMTFARLHGCRCQRYPRHPL